MYSFHSSLEEKNQLLHTLTTYGIETTVDRSKKKDRIREWIQASAITEENEGDEESDAYEDSTEFYEDEDRENESEDAERVPMRGRHFPERRPSDLGKGRRRASRGRSSASIKPIERKIPFAPQVAEERETIARFASFPNGDPSLAAVGNSRDLCATLASAIPDASAVNPATSILQSPNVSIANGRGFEDPAKANGGQESSLPVPADAIFPTKPSISQTSSAEAASSLGGSRVAPMSPQIPARKNRAQTAPFARKPEDRTESARRAQSVTALRTPEVDDPPRVSVVASPRPLRADNPIAAMSSSSRVVVVARSARAERAAAPPTTSDEPTVSPPRLPKNASLARAEDSAVSSRATPENASASCLVMQSFSAFQDLAANGGGAPLSRPAQRADELTLTYGKDAYEHYGIAHGAILPTRVNVVRQDSAGSGSRSASN